MSASSLSIISFFIFFSQSHFSQAASCSWLQQQYLSLILETIHRSHLQHKAAMDYDFAFPSFESHGGCLEPFQDGHCPETFRCAQSSKLRDSSRIVRYKRSLESDSEASVHVYNGVLHPHHVQMIYEATARTEESTQHLKLVGESPWGTYVTVEEALDWINWTEMNGERKINATSYQEYMLAWREAMIDFHKWKKERKSKSSLNDEKKEEQFCITMSRDDNVHDEDMDHIRHALAVEAVAKFFIETIPSSAGDDVTKSDQNESKSKQLYTKSDFLQQAHGVAVWALSSRPGASVQYHIDYAELLRYEYNVTVPPLWAGTIQCSALCHNPKVKCCDDTESEKMMTKMVGGDFCVNLMGLEHYAKHGYKGMISGDPMGGWTSPNTTTDEVHFDCSNKWVTIPYAFNRGIVHNGDLPHLSSPITSIDDDHLSRVIIGFNVFGYDVGERVALAPEHSRPFRKKVRLYRSTLNASKTDNGGNMNLSQIRKNKGLTKLLVLAKRERVKEQLRRDQNQLTCDIWKHLLTCHKSNKHASVGDMMDKFGIPNTISGWPTPVDVHVHLNNLLKRSDGKRDNDGRYQCVDGIHYEMILVDELESSLVTASAVISITKCEIDDSG